jgi:hypothetical protein
MALLDLYDMASGGVNKKIRKQVTPATYGTSCWSSLTISVGFQSLAG